MVRKTTKLTEKEIESYFMWSLEMAGGKSYKFRSPSQVGVADRIACFPNGQTWFVELKKGRGASLISPMQYHFEEEVKALNQKHIFLWDKKGIDDFINRVMNPILRIVK